MDKKTCLKYISDYKESCKIIYSEIKCKADSISKMNIVELNTYLKKIKNLRNRSKKCYEYRIYYKNHCVDRNKRDTGHEHAIEKAFKYYEMC